MRRYTSEIVYWFIVIAVYWWMTYDGPPLRVVAWYGINRVCKTVAYHVGRLGLTAERKYLDSVEKMTTC